MTYQHTTIIGNVGRDPDFRYTKDGIAVLSFSVATNRTWKDQNGETQSRPTWWRVTIWRRRAEALQNIIQKGQLLLVTGTQVEANAYIGKDGEARATLDITADNIEFLSRKGDYSHGVGDNDIDAASGGYPKDNDFAPNDVDDIPF